MIKNVIFDFGDVFINLDKELFYKKMLQLNIAPYSNETIKFYQQYEKGMMKTEDFTTIFTQKFQIKKEDLVTAWNSILLDFPKHRLIFLKELFESKKYRLFLLSNTNDLHITWIKENWGIAIYNEFKNYFEQFYLSFEINLRKPDVEIYNFVLEKNNLKPSETVFVDDLSENTETAKKIGIKTWNLNPHKEDVVEFVNKNF